MIITITGLSDDIWSEEFSPEIDMVTVKMLYCDAVGAQPNNVRLTRNGDVIKDELKTLQELGLSNDEILLAVEQQFQPANSRRQRRPESRPVETYHDGARKLLQQVEADRGMLARFDQSWKGMADACRAKDINKIAELLKLDFDKKTEEQQRLRDAYANPSAPGSRALIDSHENQKAIDESLAIAMEESPEMFGTVIMLYIQCKVNNCEIKAFVDSGAQMTIMSASCARKCDLMRLLDTRFSGMAQGVGTQKILGRIHTGQIQIGRNFIGSTFSVMEDQPMDLIIGLDMLKRHQCNIDLMAGQLVIGSTGTRTDFLSEADLPKHARLTQKPSENELQDVEEMEISNAIEASKRDAPQCSKPLPPTPLDRKVRQVMEMTQCDRELAAEVLEESGGDPNAAALKLLTSGVARSQPRKRSRQN